MIKIIMILYGWTRKQGLHLWYIITLDACLIVLFDHTDS